jgi:two-component system chemotaxis response regulator CheB
VLPTPYIVVIGGSAGAFRALEIILPSLPADLHAAICIVLHMQPSGESWLPRRLSSFSKLPMSAPDDEPIRGTHVYTAIPDRHLVVKEDRVISTHGPRENLWRPAIDVLFRSAAVTHSTRVIGVLLSGELDDGTAGLQAIARCGGTTIVQRPADAEYPAMPEVALANARIDHSVNADEIGPLISRLISTPPTEPPPIPDELRDEVRMAEDLSEVLTSDFSSESPSGFTCPECAGPLWRRGEGESAFRCLIGHAYQLGSLLQAHDSDLDRTLWAAIRSFEQRANIAQMMSDQAKGRGFQRRSEMHALRAEEARSHAMRLRQLQSLHRTAIEETVEE